MAKACLFCGVEGPGILSDEHVIPQWLLDHVELPADDLMFHGVASSATGELTRQPRIHSSFNFVEGRVCEQCNTGWMSKLESMAKPILIPLLDETRTVGNLSVEERGVVWKWAAKTAYLHTWAGPLKNAVQRSHLHALHGPTGVPVPGVHVFGMQAGFNKKTAYYQTGTWPHFAPPAEPVLRVVKNAAGSYKIGLQFKHLYLLTAFWPEPFAELVLTAGAHIPIWPMKSDPWSVWSYEGPETDHAIGKLIDFADSLALKHPTTA
ncbi:MAG: hypothetical protein AB7F99_11760 [Vicinamibacterales bacterium]